MHGYQISNLIPKNRNGAFWKQLQYVNIAYTTYFLFGIVRGYAAFLLLQLKATDSIIKIDLEAESYIASLNIFANPVGSVFAGFLMDKIGRKLMLQLSMLIVTLGWILVTYSDSLNSLYAGNIVVGLAVGMGACSTTYVAEICDVKNRCMLLSFLEIYYSSGILIAYVLTCYMKWNSAAFIFTMFSIISSILLHWIPESPLWLIKQGRIAEALKAFKKTHPGVVDGACDKEFEVLEKTSNEKLEVTGTFTAIKDNAKAFFILILFHVLLQGTGYNILLTYVARFLTYMNLPSSSKDIVAIGYSVAAFVASFLTPFTVNYWPRRTATMVSGSGIAVSLAFLGIYGTFLDFPEINSFWYIVPLNLYISLIFCTIGVLTLSQSMIGELYPIEVRGIMCGSTEAIATILSGVTVSLYPRYERYFSVQIFFYIFSFFGLLTVVYGYYILPETFGKSLDEIQTEYFKRRKSKSSDSTIQPDDQVAGLSV